MELGVFEYIFGPLYSIEYFCCQTLFFRTLYAISLPYPVNFHDTFNTTNNHKCTMYNMYTFINMINNQHFPIINTITANDIQSVSL